MERIYRLGAIEKTLELAAESLPKEIALYDFGVDITIAPVPDLCNIRPDYQYLTDHMAAVERVRHSESDPVIVTGFKFDIQFVTARQLIEGIEKAAEYNKTQTEGFKIL